MYPKEPLKTILDPNLALGTGVNSHLKLYSSAGTEGVHATSSDLFRKVTLQKNPAVAPIERSQPLPEGGRTMAFPLRIISNKQTDPAMIKNSSSI